MRILLLGGGGREHALAWKLAQSPRIERLVAAPGNAGIANCAECAALDILDPAAVTAFARDMAADLVVVGPEAPLAAGVADALRAAGIAVFGPDAAAARLESSKSFAKEICDACGAPTAPWARFTDAAAAKAHLRAQGAPIVIKADGLAAGKGVVVAMTVGEAEAAVDGMLTGALGAAGAEVVIEAFMPGEEASFFALCDGQTAVPLGSAQDYKRAFDGDNGPNTGGMGAFSPAAALTPALEADVMERVVLPVLAEMAGRGAPFKGVLYVGLMIAGGAARVVEFNVRFGDPEAQALMLRLESDLALALTAAAAGDLAGAELRWSQSPSLAVTVAAKGYPGAYGRGEEITGLDAAEAKGAVVFHAGTARDGDGALVSAGGRVLTVAARGTTLADARDRAYEAAGAVDWPGGFMRSDIGEGL